MFHDETPSYYLGKFATQGFHVNYILQISISSQTGGLNFNIYSTFTLKAYLMSRINQIFGSFFMYI